MNRERFQEFINSIRDMRHSVTDEQALETPGIYPDWREDQRYEVDDRVRYGDDLYRCLQSHTAQSTWTPTDAVSLWAKVLIPGGGIPRWEQPDSTNPYMTGDKVRYDNKVWVSLIDNNVWAPGTYGWQEVPDEE